MTDLLETYEMPRILTPKEATEHMARHDRESRLCPVTYFNGATKEIHTYIKEVAP